MVDRKAGIEVVEVNEQDQSVRICSTAMPHIILKFQLTPEGKVIFAGREGPAHLTDYLYGKLRNRADRILRDRFGSPRRSGK